MLLRYVGITHPLSVLGPLDLRILLTKFFSCAYENDRLPNVTGLSTYIDAWIGVRIASLVGGIIDFVTLRSTIVTST